MSCGGSREQLCGLLVENLELVTWSAAAAAVFAPLWAAYLAAARPGAAPYLALVTAVLAYGLLPLLARHAGRTLLALYAAVVAAAAAAAAAWPVPGAAASAAALGAGLGVVVRRAAERLLYELCGPDGLADDWSIA